MAPPRPLAAAHRIRWIRPVPAAALAFGLLVALLGTALPAAAQNPWDALSEVRRSLEALGPSVADFEQTYQPAGFSGLERESGKVSLDLPDCLRWDYRDPFPKSYLICSGQVYSWEEGDKVGQRAKVDASREVGLDLVLLAVDELRLRYSAETLDSDSGALEIRLTPVVDTERLSEAVLRIAGTPQRLREVSYRDAAGGRTTFTLSDYQSLADRSAFTPPPGLDWKEP